MESTESIDTNNAKTSNVIFKIYALMLGVCGIITVKEDAKLIDIVKSFIKQINDESLNKLTDESKNHRKYDTKFDRKNTIQNMLSLSLHYDGKGKKELFKYEEFAYMLDFNTCAKHIKCRELDLAYKMYGDAHYSMSGNYTTFSPAYSRMKPESVSRQSSIIEIKEKSNSISEEALDSISKISLLSHYKVWETSNSGTTSEKILGVDRYGIYLYSQEWKHLNDKHKLESGTKKVINISSINKLEACKINTCKFYLYYIDKKERIENRLFLELATHKLTKELLLKIRLLITSEGMI